jgi:beta-lactam-binding protein with PASTA domain
MQEQGRARFSSFEVHRSGRLALALFLLLAAVSSAYSQSYVALPRALMGMSEDQARTLLQREKLRVVTRHQASPAELGTVIGVVPKVETKVQRGSEVVLIVARGVPNVLNQQLSAAQKILQAVGLTGVPVERQRTAVRASDIVTGQIPRADGPLRSDGRVLLRVTERVEVPDVRRKPLADAEKILRELELNPVVRERRPTGDVPPDIVLAQRPTRGGQPGPNGEVALAVSDAPPPPPAVVPNVVGRDLYEASQILKQRGLTAVRGEQRRTAVRASDIVTAQNPRADAPLPPDRRVLLRVTERVPVPNVIGRSHADAKKILRDVELNSVSRAVPKPSNEYSQDTVIEQEPQGGGQADPSREVSLTVAAPLLVPNVVGRSEHEAIALLNDIGLTGTVKSRVTDTNRLPGVVLTQSQPADKPARGKEVGLEIAAARPEPLKPPPVPPDPPKPFDPIAADPPRIRLGPEPKPKPKPKPGPAAAQGQRLAQPDGFETRGQSKSPRSNDENKIITRPPDPVVSSFPMPNVRWKPFADAHRELAANGLVATRGALRESEQAADTVLEQSPAAETLVSRGAQVVLTVSRYVAPPPPPPWWSRWRDDSLVVGLVLTVALMAFTLWKLTRPVITTSASGPTGPSERPARSEGPTSMAARLTVRPTKDIGKQSVDIDQQGIDWSVSVRVISDAGKQSLEPSQPAIREDSRNG